jgi:2C-methyl-D-erythritol 2,4-cyclodiphosphate synthase
MSFANSPSYSTTREYSPTKTTKDGYFKIRFLAKDPYTLLSGKNFVGKGDIWTANRNKEAAFGDYFSLQSVRIDNSNLNVRSDVFDINNLTASSNERMMQQNRDIAALSLATMASTTDFIEGNDIFEESLYTYQNVVSVKKIETVFRELLAGGFNETNINVRAADLKAMISQSQKYASTYLEAVDNLKKILSAAVDLVNTKYTNVNNVAFVRALSAYVSDMYIATKGDFAPTNVSLYNQFDTQENNDFVKELYNPKQ